MAGMNTKLDSTEPALRRIIDLPRTQSGWWSITLAGAFLVLFPLWLVYVSYWRPMPRPTFFSDPVHALLILGAATAAISGGIVGALALALKRERSFTVVLSVILGAFALYLTIAWIINPNP